MHKETLHSHVPNSSMTVKTLWDTTVFPPPTVFVVGEQEPRPDIRCCSSDTEPADGHSVGADA